MNLTLIKQAAIEAAHSAGDIIKSKKITQSHFKDKNNIVTNIDIAAEKKIISIIQQKFPNHSIIAEEKGVINKHKHYRWIIDPLDGTANYERGIPLVCVLIAFTIDEQCKIAVTLDPYHDQIFYAQQGKGSYLNQKKIRVSKTKKLSQAMCGFGFGNKKKMAYYINKIMPHCYKVRIPGSTGIGLAYVSAGIFDSFLATDLNIWDFAAGKLLIEEAGGRVEVIGHKKKKKRFSLLASNQVLHQTLKNKLK